MDTASAERAAMESAFREHYASMCQFVWRYVRSYDVAEDIVQDVWASLWRRSYDPAQLTKAYLYAAARNRALHYLEHRAVTERHALAATALDVDRDMGDSALRTIEADELNRVVERAIAELPDRCRTIYSLIRNDGLTYAEAASVLGLSVSTVEVQMWRALKKLRTALGPHLLAIPILLALR